jgi:leucyl-tRNA synthetase
LATKEWPMHDKSCINEDIVTLAIQVNGKLRCTYDVYQNSNEESIRNAVLNLEAVKKHTSGLNVRKIIIVQNKIVNIVAS